MARPFAFRPVLRQHIRRQLREATDPAEIMVLQELLRSRRVFARFAEEVEVEVEDVEPTPEPQPAPPGPIKAAIKALLKWLWEHKELILQIALTVISLLAIEENPDE